MMLERKGFIGFIYTLMEWITRIAYINILWVFFSLLGLLIFGIAPATLAMFTVTKKFIIDKIPDVRIFSTFWTEFKSNFLRANGLVWPLLLVAYILYIDFQYLPKFPGILYYIMLFVFVNVTIIFIIVSLYIFPVYINFRRDIWESYKFSFVIGISYPFTTISMLVAIFVLGLFLERIPGLIPFFSISLVSFTINFFTNVAFTKLEEKSN